MTIGKKLYWGFGSILAVILFLFVINIFTVMRQYSTRSAVASTLADVQTIEGVRYKMIENRLSLGNYLLSGDLRDEEKTNKGVAELQDLLKTAETKATDAALRSSLSQVEDNERGWAENFAKEMIAKRHSGGFRGLHRLRFADLLPAARSGFLDQPLGHDPGRSQPLRAQSSGRFHRVLVFIVDGQHHRDDARDVAGRCVRRFRRLLHGKVHQGAAQSPDRSGAQNRRPPAISTRPLISIAATKWACSPRISTK